MGEGKPTTVWTCDRCGTTTTLPSTEQPKWTAIYIVNPPRREVCDERIAWLLCKSCDSSLAAWKCVALDPEEAGR